MPRSTIIERWESDPDDPDDRCDVCGAASRLVRVTRSEGQAGSSKSLRLCPRCLEAHSTHHDLLERVKSQYPHLSQDVAHSVCEKCGAPAEVFSCHVEVEVHHHIRNRGNIRSTVGHSFCSRCAPRPDPDPDS